MPRPATSSLERGSLFLYLWKKGAPILQFRITLIITVSIHAPLKGATIIRATTLRRRLCFNSRTPKGCDGGSRLHRGDTRQVSIHAPLKGATSSTCVFSSFNKVSIHAPLKGATSSTCVFSSFNKVSIHAPLKGATPSLLLSKANHSCFNSRTPKGCDYHRLREV